MHALQSVFRETGSVTHKKGAGRPIVATEEIVTRSKLRRTFSNPWPPLAKIIFDIPVHTGVSKFVNSEFRAW
jgi:hypothetical protein